MQAKPSIFIKVAIAALMIGLGFAVGLYFSGSRTAKQEPAPAQEAAIKPNFNTYKISPPSRATTLITKDITLKPENNTATVTIPMSEASDIKTGQKVFLYDIADLLIDTIGEVSAVDLGDDQIVTVSIHLNGDQSVPVNNVAKGEIIIARRPNTARLPLSALVKTPQGDSAVWEASENADGTRTAYLKPVTIIVQTEDYFAPELNSTFGNSFILNPDNNLQDGQIINVQRTPYSAPPELYDNTIVGRMEGRRRYNAAIMGGNGAKRTCGQVRTTKQFIDKVNTLSAPKELPPPPAQSTPR